MRSRINKVYTSELRNGDYSDYVNFVHKFLQAGGKASGISGDLWEIFQTDLFIATADCNVPVAHGSSAITVIVPESINVTSGGHNKLMFMDDPLKGRPTVSIDKFTARMLRDRGLTLTPDHFRQPHNENEFLWDLDRLNGHGLMARFKRAHDNDRLTKPIIRERLRNFGHALERLPF